MTGWMAFWLAPVPWLPAPLVLRWGWPALWAALGAGLIWGLARRWAAWSSAKPGLSASCAVGTPSASVVDGVDAGTTRLGVVATDTAGLACPLWGKLLASAWVALALGPTSWSPVQWLGLAFQAPSLFAVAAMGVWALAPSTRGQGDALPGGGVSGASLASFFIAASALLTGAVLVFDGYVWGAAAVYAWGFSASAWVAAGAWWLGLVLLGGGTPDGRRWAVALGLALALGVLTRLPTGNAWAAVNDPWLSLWALAWLLHRGGQAAIRAATARFAATRRSPR